MDFQKDLFRVSDGELSEELKEVVHEESLYIYDEFDAKYYEDRYDNDGFGDENNIVSNTVLTPNSGINIEVRNDALANGDDEGEYLDVYIEDGIYKWNNHPDKRPFMERSIERVEREQIVENVLEYQLKKRGWDIK